MEVKFYFQELNKSLCYADGMAIRPVKNLHVEVDFELHWLCSWFMFYEILSRSFLFGQILNAGCTCVFDRLLLPWLIHVRI